METITHDRRLKRISLRITVSGTRGKSGVTRDIASVLRASGRRVLAKTTGSEAMYILPDGSREPVRRRGIVSIIEQKKLVARAAKIGADCLVAEVMSIRPENHRFESRRLLKPGITVLTNFRADHLDVTGETTRETESLFLNDVCRGATIFVHENHLTGFLKKGIAEEGATIEVTPTGCSTKITGHPGPTPFRIRENSDLVYKVAVHLGIGDNEIAMGIVTARHDTGRAELFRFRQGSKTVWFANTFAANDPVSTNIIIDLMLKESAIPFRHIAGLLALRNDRAERTLQWIRQLRQNYPISFDPLFVAGSHRNIVRRKIAGAIPVRRMSPGDMTCHLAASCEDGTVVFGLANIAGTGSGLLDYWRENCESINQHNET